MGNWAKSLRTRSLKILTAGATGMGGLNKRLDNPECTVPEVAAPAYLSQGLDARYLFCMFIFLIHLWTSIKLWNVSNLFGGANLRPLSKMTSSFFDNAFELAGPLCGLFWVWSPFSYLCVLLKNLIDIGIMIVLTMSIRWLFIVILPYSDDNHHYMCPVREQIYYE